MPFGDRKRKDSKGLRLGSKSSRKGHSGRGSADYGKGVASHRRHSFEPIKGGKGIGPSEEEMNKMMSEVSKKHKKSMFSEED